MPFGSKKNDPLEGLGDQISQTLQELEALKRQLADQQQAIQRNDAATADTRRGLAGLHDDLTRLGQRVEEVSAPPDEAQPGHETAEADHPRPDPAILKAAAGIAHATVEAQRDTWAFLIQVAGNEPHFHIPGKVDDNDGFVSVRFSGPSLVAALASLARVPHKSDNPVTQAIAGHIQDKITSAVQEIIDNPHTRPGEGTLVRIVIDDRPAATEE